MPDGDRCEGDVLYSGRKSLACYGNRIEKSQRNELDAVELWRETAEDGDADAMHAMKTSTGRGVGENEREAAE
jgi:hypothetical protein